MCVAIASFTFWKCSIVFTPCCAVGDHDDDFAGIRSFASSGFGGFQQQHQGAGGGMPGGFFPSFGGFGGFGGIPGMSTMNGFGSGGGAGFGRKEPPIVRDISLTLVPIIIVLF